MEKKTKTVVIVACTVLALLTISIAALTTPSGTSGPPVVDHGRQKSSDEQGLLLGLIFGDQWVIVRDLSITGNGKPIYFTWTWPPAAYTPDGDFDPPAGVYPTEYSTSTESGCVQPVSFEPVLNDPAVDEFELGTGLSDVVYFDSYGRERLPTYLIPLDPECKIPDIYADTWGTQVMEPDSGRFNMARAPQNVIDAAYEEVIRIMNEAESFSLDPAGRLVVELAETDGDETYLKTIDSPLENLALYQRLMQNSCLPDTDNISLSGGSLGLLAKGGLGNLVCGTESGYSTQDFLQAASFMAGAGDKTGRINVDLVIYLNNRLEVNDVAWSDDKQNVTIGYYDFLGASYNRRTEHGDASATLLQPPANSNPLNYPNSFDVAESVPLFTKRFTDDWPNSSGNPVAMETPIVNFVRAADDALAIINYIHNYALPTYPLLPIEEPTYQVE